MPVIKLERNEHGNPVALPYHEDRFIQYFNKLMASNNKEIDSWVTEFNKRRAEYWLKELFSEVDK
jgi:hypothetical protein